MGGTGPLGIDAQVLKMEDRLAQLERLLRRFPDAGSLVELTQLIQNPFDFKPTRIYQADDSLYTTSGFTELAILTMTVPTHTYATIQYPMAHFGFSMTVSGDEFACRIRENSVTGTILGNTGGRAANAGYKVSVPIVFADPVSVAAATTKSYVLTIRRTIGTGTASGLGTTSETGIKVIVLPDLP